MGFLSKTIGAVVKPVAGLLGMGGGGGYQGYAEEAPIKRGNAPLPVAGALTPEQGNAALRNNLMLLNSRYTPEERTMTNALAGRYAPGQRSAYDVWMRNFQNDRGQNLTYAPELTRRLPYRQQMEMTAQGPRMSSYDPYGQYNWNDYYGG